MKKRSIARARESALSTTPKQDTSRPDLSSVSRKLLDKSRAFTDRQFQAAEKHNLLW
jgi:hypothetical protein